MNARQDNERIAGAAEDSQVKQEGATEGATKGTRRRVRGTNENESVLYPLRYTRALSYVRPNDPFASSPRAHACMWVCINKEDGVSRLAHGPGVCPWHWGKKRGKELGGEMKNRDFCIPQETGSTELGHNVMVRRNRTATLFRWIIQSIIIHQLIRDVFRHNIFVAIPRLI